MTTAPVYTLTDVHTLPPVLTLEQAAAVLGIGRTSAYALAKHGAFPAPVLRIGKLYRVPTTSLLNLIGAAGPSPEPVDFGPGTAPAACATPASRASIHLAS